MINLRKINFLSIKSLLLFLIFTLFVGISLIYLLFPSIVPNIKVLFFPNTNLKESFTFATNVNGEGVIYRPKKTETIFFKELNNNIVIGNDPQTYQTYSYLWEKDTHFLCMSVDYPKEGDDYFKVAKNIAGSNMGFSSKNVLQSEYGKVALDKFKKSVQAKDIVKIVLADDTKTSDTKEAIFVFLLTDNCSI